ncbi:germinal-center associated nuclear protein [Mixophyes fleayi]|uniref:germinal-center associated nuclear protein n=1 Tax=Mixophyes fleayi TaxID=3061075 RepID=UPI003F4DD8F5
MNPNNLFVEPQTSSTNNQNNFMFGQTSLFGQSAADQSAPTFGQTPPIGQSPQLFGQLSSSQPATVFGQNTTSQSSIFGQTTVTQSSHAFGQASAALPAPTFGQATAGTSSSIFGQTAAGHFSATFGQASAGQSAPTFGQTSTGQSAPTFGQTSTGQSAPTFGHAAAGQSAPTFGQASAGQSAPAFGQASTGQSVPAFGQAATGQSAPAFGQAAAGQSAPAFGQAAAGQSAPAFGQAAAGQSAPAFGQAAAGQSAPAFGQAAAGQTAPAFGQAAAGQSAPAFGQTSAGQSAPPFGHAYTGQSAPTFGQATSGQSAPAFGQATPGQSAPTFGQATSGQSAPTFGQVTSGQSAPTFGQATSGQSAPTFGQSAINQSISPFGQATAPVFGLGNGGQSTLFGQSSTGQTGPTFGQGNTSQASVFGLTTTSQSASPFAQAPSSQTASSFGQTTSNQPASLFAQPATIQSTTPFGNSATVFGQAATGSSVFEQSASKQSERELNQSSLFGQPASGSSFAFNQPASGQTPLFGQSTTSQTFGQATFTQSAQANTGQSNFSESGFQSTFGIPSTSQESSAEFGQLNSAQPPSYAQATSAQTFGIASTAQTGHSGKTNVFGETGDKTSVFGPPSNTSSSGQTINAGQAFGATMQMSTGSIVPDSKSTTGMTASPFSHISSMSSASSELNFKPLANTTFKPILTGSSKPSQMSTSSFTLSTQAKSEVMEQPMFGIPTVSSESVERQSSSFFTFSSDKKRKDESGSSGPPFASADSSFSSFAEDPRREEFLKGVKRKEDQGRSPRKNEFASSDDSSPDLRSDHPPVKRSSRLNRDLTGGANLLVRSLYDVVKSQMKSQHRKDPKKEEKTVFQINEPDPDSSAPGHSGVRSHPLAGSSQTGIVKTISAVAVASQPTFSKTQPPATVSQIISSKMVSAAGLGHQAPERDYSTSGASQLVSGRIQPLLEEGELPEDFEDTSSKTPVNKEQPSDNIDRSVPLSPSDLTAIIVRNLPPILNQRQVLENHFKKFGKIQRLYCRPINKTAIIHYYNHSSAAAAKRAGKRLHKDVSIFWHRKKPSPTKKETLLSKKEKQIEERGERLGEEENSSVASPGRTSLLRGLKGSPHKKSVFSKTLHFDVDSPDAPALSSDTTGSSLKPSLVHLVGTVAETSEEKYRLLDQRDKILRQARVKRTELDQAKLFVGTCPDMCPEKERYMRETRKQLSIYEFFPGTDKLDHAAAIKEYSRSSADQEEPLPHELRPMPVLCMTMNYLVTRIMDQGEANYRDWYDFVWNRTRGIRKDITQQHLSDPFTVSLMEKCMRFHIHCAYQLCEEPMSSFDPKINNENLTKCLQSLKEMYKDLHNRGETCTCEPEFRGYSVLLNLNQGDILREVQQFPQTIRNSEEVKFAVQVFSALNSTNYVQFFKLVRSASYLNSCILHCYFGQIRRDALRVLNVAYTPSILRPTLFQLENMVRLLFFQDADDATEFLTAYGLCVSDGFVELNRTAFAEPDVPLQPKRCSFLSNKRQVSIGEIVNGAPLPQCSLHMPACSFDDQNKYTGSSTSVDQGVRDGTATDKLLEGKDPAPEEMSVKRTIVLLPDTQESSPVPAQAVLQPLMPCQLPPPKPTFSEEDVAAVIDDIVEDTVKEFSADLGQAGAMYISAALGESYLVADKLLGDVIMDFSNKIAVDEVKAETERVKEEKRRKAEEARRILEKERMLSMLSQSQCEALLNEVITESICKISTEELQQAVQLDHQKRILRCSQHVGDQFVGQFVDDEISLIAMETLCEMQCCNKYIQRWREVLAARKKLRRQMRGFPAAPGSVGRDGQLKALIPSATHDVQNLSKGIIDMGHAGKLCVSFTRCQKLREQIFHQMKVQHFLQELLCDAAWTPLELPSLIAQNISGWKQCIFWKVAIALPEITEPSDPNSILSEWLKAKFCWAGDQPSGDQKKSVQTLALYSSLESHGGCPVRVNVCVKVVHGPLTDPELEQAEIQKQFLGTSGVILLLPPQSDASDVYWLSAVLQLKQLLQAKPFKPAPSLAVLVPGSDSNMGREVEEELSLSDLVSCGLISNYIVLTIPNAVNNLKGTDVVSSAVQFLLSHCPPSLELLSLPFQQYIEDGVCSAFSDPFYHDVSERRKVGLPSQDPAAIIDLYNHAIAFLAEAVSSDQLCELSWPVTEFTSSKGSSLIPPTDWNSPDHLAALKKAILSFQLPQMDKPPQGAPWNPVCSMIMGYVSQISQSPNTLPLLLSEVQLLLRRICKQWLEKDEFTGLEPSVQDIPWDDLIAVCINHKLRDWEPPLLADAKGFHEKLYVYFFKEDLKSFTHPETWGRARLDTLQDTLVADKSPPCRKKRSLQTSQSLPSFCKTHEENTQENPELSYLKTLSSKLNRSLLAEKNEDERFNERLQNLLEEKSPNASLCLPLYVSIPSLHSLESAIVPTLQKSSTYSAMYSPSKPESLVDSIVHSPSLGTSLKDRMKSLKMNIKRQQQEDIAFSLHLSTLLDVAQCGEPSQNL